MREIEFFKKIPFKIWLPWKRQVTWTATCHIKLLPDKFWKKSPSLVAFALISKKLLTPKVTAGRIRPPPPPPSLNRVRFIADTDLQNDPAPFCYGFSFQWSLHAMMRFKFRNRIYRKWRKQKLTERPVNTQNTRCQKKYIL